MRWFLLFLLVRPCAAGEFTAELWSAARPVYQKTLDHPFLAGLADGSLPRSRFRYYLIQDALYLSEFSKALSALAAKAPREQWRITLNKHAVDAIETERQLHRMLLAGVEFERFEMAPTNRAYTNHLLATVYTRPFAEGLAAMLPCYWIYWEVGKELKRRGSKDRDYQRWIDQYSDPAYGTAVDQVLDMMNREAARMDDAQRAVLRRLFLLSARYEYMFWDMAWREESWAP